jgi:very-short-patch-repair endonuclease
MSDNAWLRAAAQAQRAQMSDAERKVWYAVRARRLAGLKFRRQHLIGRYIADFYCADARLVVEIDGNHHAEQTQAEHDRIRDGWMAGQGLNVVRFTVHEVLQDFDSVMERIALEVGLVD